MFHWSNAMNAQMVHVFDASVQLIFSLECSSESVFRLSIQKRKKHHNQNSSFVRLFTFKLNSMALIKMKEK